MIDSRKNTITAKVSAQVVDFYRLSVKNLDQCNAEQIINSRSYKVIAVIFGMCEKKKSRTFR